MKKTLQIISSTHAREINTKENMSHWRGKMSIPSREALIKYQEWEQAESSLKEYRIEGYDPTDNRTEIFIEGRKFTRSNEPLVIGSLHECETNEENLTCIII